MDVHVEDALASRSIHVDADIVAIGTELLLESLPFGGE